MATRFAITTALIAYLLTAVTHADEQEQEVRQSLAERYQADAKRIIDATLAEGLIKRLPGQLVVRVGTT